MTFVDIDQNLAFFILRLAIGIVFLAHGPQKFKLTTATAKSIGLPVELLKLVGFLETLGAASMILGVWTQAGAIFLATVMLGAIYMKTQKWGKKFTGENGWELDFIMLAAVLAVFLGAPATYSIFGG
ncbi:MAG: DoxX family protein [Candidatus Andersenbacteria bacterium]